MLKIGFCGVGVMGSPMAGHLVDAGHSVFIYNRTKKRAVAWLRNHAGAICDTPAELASQCDVVMMCVGNDDDVRQVVTAPSGVLAGMKPGTLVVDHTTTSAELAREMAQCIESAGGVFIDAPVSGGQAGAVKGVLTVMCGARNDEDFARFNDIAGAYSSRCMRMGDIGTGQLTKMVNQICIAGLVQALAEGVSFAQKAGLDAHQVIDVISKGAAGSWQMENRGHTMIDQKFDFGFAVEWMVKDVNYCIAEAARIAADIPVTQLVQTYFEDLMSRGDTRLDTSSLVKRLAP
ncbi:MAG: NAD(P)-dependent oxidoreductase [Ilumatobacteraceae bacterium]|nr:NAD(P)-dependent oxidoreductase [Ilumatobacteraceae bacterium]